MKKPLMVVIATSVMMSNGPLLAASIIYTGSQQVGSIAARYSITTDGNLGNINANDVTAFNISLSDAIGTISFDQLTGGIAGPLRATARSLASFGDLQFYTNTAYNYAYIGAIAFQPTSTRAQIADMAHGGTDLESASEANQVSFATATPEPAAWAMMIAGLGAVGYAMRRRHGTAADMVPA